MGGGGVKFRSVGVRVGSGVDLFPAEEILFTENYMFFDGNK
jgi:hypothetical protein